MNIRHKLFASTTMPIAFDLEGGGEGGGGTPAPSPAPAPSPGEHEDFSAFEQSIEEPAEPATPGSGDDVDPAAPASGDDPNAPPPEGNEDQGASVQERIDELTAARREAEREAAEERRLRADLEARLAKLEKPDDGQPKERSPDERPDPKDYEFGEADGKYIEDLAVWRVDTRNKELDQQRALETEMTQVETTWSDNISKPELAEKYPDFADKVTKGADAGKWSLSPLGVVLVKSSEVGADVAYHLASNPDESRAIAAMNPFEQAQAIGRLEGRFLAANAEPKPQGKIVSDAPPPPDNRSRGAGGRFEVEADTEDFGAFEAKADAILSKTK